jgi:hypothetical protein
MNKIFTRLLPKDNGLKRKKLAARYAHGLILDVGCSQSPNNLLVGKEVIGLDVIPPQQIEYENYSEFILGDCNNIKKYLKEKNLILLLL